MVTPDGEAPRIRGLLAIKREQRERLRKDEERLAEKKKILLMTDAATELPSVSAAHGGVRTHGELLDREIEQLARRLAELES